MMLGDMVLEPGQSCRRCCRSRPSCCAWEASPPRPSNSSGWRRSPADLPARTLTIPVDLRPYVRIKLKGQPTDKNQWEKEKRQRRRPRPRVFPEVAQTAASAPTQMAQNTAVPRAVPVDEPHGACVAAGGARSATSRAVKPDPAVGEGR